MSKLTDTVAKLAAPVIEKQGCTLWDVEYVKEAGHGISACISTTRTAYQLTSARR